MKQQKLAEMSEEERLAAQAQEWKEKAEKQQKPSSSSDAPQKYRKQNLDSSRMVMVVVGRGFESCWRQNSVHDCMALYWLLAEQCLTLILLPHPFLTISQITIICYFSSNSQTE